MNIRAIGAGGTGPAGCAVAGEGGDEVAAGGAVVAGRADAVVEVAIAQCAAPAGLACAGEAGRGRSQRAHPVRARLRRAGVVHALAVGAGKTFGAGAQVLVGRRVLASAAVLARLVGAAVVEIWRATER